MSALLTEREYDEIAFYPGLPIWIDGVAYPGDGRGPRKIVTPGVVVEIMRDCLKIREWPSLTAMEDGKRGKKRLAAYRDCWPREEPA